ncbi:MAG TPA: efflux RND transporter periplasmic adaptor subunit [Gemmatimonadaceae bacterium]|nr:efflux RND transporter periplasmic adaptor subunit [Gemmatimonadaceae bacterium]
MLTQKAWVAIPMLALALIACDGGNAQQMDRSPTPVAVHAAPVTDTTLARRIVAAGSVIPADEATLSFKVGGVIARIDHDEGDVVRKGALLATLDLREIEASLARARSAASKAQRDVARARRLYADSVVSLSQMQDSETAADIADAELRTAAFNRSYAVIVAPFNGVVLERTAEPGEMVSPGAPVVVLGSRAQSVVMEVGIADRDVLALREGDSAIARFDALPGREFVGLVTRIGAAADARTGTYAVEITLRDAGRLTVGLVGQAELQSGRGVQTTLLPIEALVEADGSEATVFALSSDSTRARRRRVSVGFIDGNRVAVTGGLDGATAVVTDGAAYLTDGALVRVAP